MKKTIPFLVTTIILLSVSVVSKAQLTNLIFFTEQGEHFSVVLNGILQNAKPETNIKITGLPAPSYKLKVIFEDPKIPELDKNLMFQQGTETSFNIRKNNKGEYVVRFLNQVPIEQMPPPPPGQDVVVFTTVPATSVTINQTNVINNTNSTTINASSTSATGDVNMNINMGTPTITSATTTVSTSSSTTEGTEINHQNTIHPHGNHYEMPGYHGEIGCPYPMTDLDFTNVKQTIASKSFEDSKLSIAKQVTGANCLFASEVKEIMELFSFEASRLEFAKYAYRYTFDTGNYYKVNEAFQFESSIEELNKYIEGKR
ncbi:MAG: DUF4476 domain-containing protein [Bacteroidetes bacterium]|nr:DUF4476 domain-containing protein [Bacteroidota bacterium]